MAASDSYVPGLCVDGAIVSPQRLSRLSHARFLQLYRSCTFLADAITSSATILVLELLNTRWTATQAGSFHSAFALATIGGALTAVLLSKEPVRDRRDVTSRIRQTEAVLRASTTSLLFICAIDLMLHLHLLGASSVIALIAIPALVAIERHCAIHIRRRLRASGYGLSVRSARISSLRPTQRIAPVNSRRVFRFASAQRLMDVTLSGALLFLLGPLFLLIAIAIRLDSRGSAFFIQERVGKGGRRFQILKFRSMFVTARPYEVSPVRSSDPRITRVGRILRRLSLDELPQLINVIKGDMALVGPRPEMPFLVQRHRAVHQKRLKVKPGITGLWQLSGDRPRPIHENIQHDLRYIRNGSLFLDLAILAHTLFRASCGGI